MSNQFLSAYVAMAACDSLAPSVSGYLGINSAVMVAYNVVAVTLKNGQVYHLTVTREK